MTVCLGHSLTAPDAAGRPSTITDGMAQILTMVYDDADRNTQLHYADGTRVTNSFDSLGRIASQAYSLGVITNTWDSASRLTGVQFGHAAYRFTYSFDTVGNRSVMQIGDGGRFSYSYDAVNQLVSILNPYTEVTTLQYDSLGQETKRTLGNSSTISFVYDSVGRNTVIEARKSDGTLHAMYTASYDAAGNRVTVAENGGIIVSYAYDNAYQLTNEQRNGANAYNNTLTFDGNGNRLTKVTASGTTTYTADSADRLTKIQPPSGSINTMTYDNNGNVTLEQIGAVRDTYTWDAANRLSVWNSGQYSVLQTFSYDPSSLRVRKVLAARTDNYLNDGANVVQVVTGDPVVYQQLPGEWGSIFSNRFSGATKFYVPDFQGHSRLYLDSAQAIAGTALYDAWGTELVNPGGIKLDFSAFGAWDYFRDSPTRSYAWHRHYRRDWGRWISADPIGFAGGSMNLYEYVGNRPVVWIDPDGYDGLKDTQCYKDLKHIFDGPSIVKSTGLACLTEVVTSNAPKGSYLKKFGNLIQGTGFTLYGMGVVHRAAILAAQVALSGAMVTNPVIVIGGVIVGTTIAVVGVYNAVDGWING